MYGEKATATPLGESPKLFLISLSLHLVSDKEAGWGLKGNNMHYSIDDMKFRGYKVLHPTIALSKAVWGVVKMLVCVEVLWVALQMSVPFFTLCLFAIMCYWVYELTWN